MLVIWAVVYLDTVRCRSSGMIRPAGSLFAISYLGLQSLPERRLDV